MSRLMVWMQATWSRTLIVTMFIWAAAVSTVAWAQEVATTQDVAGAVDALAKSIGEKGGTFGIVALALSLVMQISKHGILGAWMFKLHPKLRFAIPIVTGALMGLFQNLQAGAPIYSALTGAVMIALPAFTAHATFKGVRPNSWKPVDPDTARTAERKAAVL